MGDARRPGAAELTPGAAARSNKTTERAAALTSPVSSVRCLSAVCSPDRPRLSAEAAWGQAATTQLGRDMRAASETEDRAHLRQRAACLLPLGAQALRQPHLRRLGT